MLKTTRAQLHQISNAKKAPAPAAPAAPAVDHMADVHAALAVLATATAQATNLVAALTATQREPAPPAAGFEAEIIRNAAGKMTHITIKRTNK